MNGNLIILLKTKSIFMYWLSTPF